MIPEHSPTKDSQGNRYVENGVQNVEEQCRAIKLGLQGPQEHIFKIWRVQGRTPGDQVEGPQTPGKYLKNPAGSEDGFGAVKLWVQGTREHV